MKKTLVAIAALAAVSSFAQSSVTLYGRADIGLTKQTGGKLTLADDADGNQSRIGFRGVEDLGGGLSALFQFEMGLDQTTGQLNNGQAAGVAPRIFQRSAFTGIRGGFGTVTAGRQNTISGKGVFWYMPNYYTNATMAAFPGGAFGGVGSRSDATIQYTSPNFSGFGFKVGTQLAGNQPTALTSTSQGLTEIGVDYSNGPLQAHLTYAKRATASGGGNAFNVNAGYNFGPATAFVAYNDVVGTNTGKGFITGLNGQMGAFKPFVHLARNTENKRTAFDLGTYYNLSKRTEVFAMFGRVKPNAAAATTKMSVGIGHNF